MVIDGYDTLSIFVPLISRHRLVGVHCPMPTAGNDAPAFEEPRMANPLPDDLLTVPETAELLKVSAVTVSRWLKQGRLPAYRVGPRAVRIRRADVDELLVPATTDQAATIPSDSSRREAGRFAASHQPDASTTIDEQWAVVEEMAALRDRILTRRKGQTFASASEDLTKTRQKKRKRL